jgi:hypothetical protein
MGWEYYVGNGTLGISPSLIGINNDPHLQVAEWM